MNELRPKLFDVIKDYTKEQLMKDIISGIIVAIIALPLSIALAIASGVSPGQGLGNIFSGLFGGIPATGAIARTAANVPKRWTYSDCRNHPLHHFNHYSSGVDAAGCTDSYDNTGCRTFSSCR